MLRYHQDNSCAQVAPAHSYIDIRGFPDEEEAGRYLQYLVHHPGKC
jgi:hypothetical protein